jgi:hypothetical protein
MILRRESMLNPLVEDANQDADGDRFSNLLLLGE